MVQRLFLKFTQFIKLPSNSDNLEHILSWAYGNFPKVNRNKEYTAIVSLRTIDKFAPEGPVCNTKIEEFNTINSILRQKFWMTKMIFDKWQDDIWNLLQSALNKDSVNSCIYDMLAITGSSHNSAPIDPRTRALKAAGMFRCLSVHCMIGNKF